MKNLIPILFILLIFSYCSIPDIPEDPKPPKWDISIERIPLLKADTLRIGEQLSDEDFERVGPDSILAVTIDSSTSFDIEEHLKLTPENQSFSEDVGNLSMSSQSETFSEQIGNFEISTDESVNMDILFKELYPALEGAEGTNIIVPPITLFPIEKDLDFDDFESVTIISGRIKFVVINNTGFPLGNDVKLELIDEGRGLIIIETIDVPRIEFNESETFYVDLAGKTISGSLLIKLYGDLVGSEGNLVYIPQNSGINITASPEEITASEATATISSQSFNVSGSMDISTDSVTLRSAEIQTGIMSVSITNSFDFPITVDISIPSITYQTGQEVNAELIINSGVSESVDINLSNTTLDLPGANLEFNTTLTINPTSNVKYTLQSTDQITVNANFSDIELSQATAKIKERSFDVSGSVDINSDSLNVKEADISTGSMNLSIYNPFEYPVDIEISIPNLTYESGQEVGAYLYIYPKNTANTYINLNNTSLDLDGKDLKFNTSMKIYPDQDQYYTFNSSDRVTVEANFSEIKLSKVTGDFDLSADFPEISEDLFDEPPEELENISFENAILTITFPNSPFDLDLNITIQAEKDGEQKTVVIDEYITQGGSLVLSDEIVELLNMIPQRISITGSAHVIGNNVTFTDDDIIDVNYNIQLPLNFSLSNATFSESDELDIDEDVRDRLREDMIYASLEMTIENAIPVFGTFTFYVGIDTTDLSTEIVTLELPQPTITDGLVSQPGIQTLEIELDTEKFQALAAAQYMKFQVNLGDVSGVKLTATDYIIVKNVYISGKITVNPESYEEDNEDSQ